MVLLSRIKSNLKYWLVVIIFTLFFLWWISNAADDLLWNLFEPSYEEDMTVKIGKNSDTVWNRFFWGSNDVSIVVKRQIKKNSNGEPLCHGDGGKCAPGCDGSEDKDECKYQHVWVDVKVTDKPSIIVKATRILLSLIIALSVTMVLYNGMMYIIQTWQWKEAKDLTKNIAYIVIWILVALFSVIIITLIQSVPETLEKEWEETSKSESDINLLK